MQAMLVHIQVTNELDDAQLYRYLFQESETIKNDLKTVKVFCRVMAQLTKFGVSAYMEQYDAVNKWMYWNVWENRLTRRKR